MANIFVLIVILNLTNLANAWIEPQDGQSISAPINTSSQSQTKQGDFNIQGNLSVDQNKNIKVGNAYLSSGGDFMHLSNNEWYDGTKWNASGKGTLLQFLGQTLNIYKHDESGNHTLLSSIDPNGNFKTMGQIYINNLGSLPNEWTGIHTQNLHARDAVRTNYLCLGGGANGDGAGDCRSNWPVTSWWAWNVYTECAPYTCNKWTHYATYASCHNVGYWELYSQTYTGANIKILSVYTYDSGWSQVRIDCLPW